MTARDLPFKTGKGYLAHIAKLESASERLTRSRIPKFGKRFPKCFECLGMTLALLDGVASCYWGCSKGDHRMEYLVGRAVNGAYAGVRLARLGYYDQALSQARALGEIANLMMLFIMDKTALAGWKTMGPPERRKQFSAVKVRLALQKLDKPIPVDEDRYRQLSAYSIHAEPDSLPQAHGPAGNAVGYPCYQEVGLIMAVNEISYAVAIIALCSLKLVDMPEERQKPIQTLALELGEQVGGVSALTKGRPWFSLN